MFDLSRVEENRKEYLGSAHGMQKYLLRTDFPKDEGLQVSKDFGSLEFYAHLSARTHGDELTREERRVS
jgi:hypothetical protein